MIPRYTETARELGARELARGGTVLMVLPVSRTLPDAARVPGIAALAAVLKRRRATPDSLARTPVVTAWPGGGLAAWVMVDLAQSLFAQYTALRKAVSLLLGETPMTVTVAVFGDAAVRAQLAERAVYVALLNAVPLPSRKGRDRPRPPQAITLFGHALGPRAVALFAQVEGNTLTRALTMLPPNELTPALYRRHIRSLAREAGWRVAEYDVRRLRRMGAGAFCAVAQGSDAPDAAIVRLSYAPKGGKKSIALVGKGICFDTGGHNLKPARYMHGMHKDMNGSAVVLGILLAATRLRLPLRIDAWLALAQNHISPRAYKQNDVVTALNGTTIEVIHTDAEGRMVLADTLTLAARAKPDVILDFATLTGSMKVALGNRYSGVLSNSTTLLDAAIAAGQASGERVCAFPVDDDYEAALESKIADIKQCTLDGDADHILAARFLMRFIDGRPWLHMDLSADDCEGGLGPVASEVTGFGVAWGVEMLRRI